jgi:hypothetical protein
MNRTQARVHGRLRRCGCLCALLCAAWVCTSCSLFAPGMSVLVHLPEPPPHWQRAFAGLSARVLYLGDDGRPREAACGAWAEPVRIVCGKLQNSPVLAFPLARTGLPGGAEEELPPAGGMFPMSVGDGDQGRTLELTWEDGCAALAVWKALEMGRDVSFFDAGRLAAKMREAPDPWAWDAIAIAEAITRGGFTSFDLDRLPCLDVHVGPVSGEWFLESPFAAVHAVSPAGRLLAAGVPAGMHTLFSAAGERIRIFVDGERAFVGPVERW